MPSQIEIIMLATFMSLPNDKILDWSELKEFADEKIMWLKFVLGRVENIVGKGENAGYQRASFSRSLKVGIVW